MIVKMKKYAFMAYHKEYDDFLHALRDIGVVHVTVNKSVTANTDMQQLLSTRKQLTPVLALLKQLNEKTESPDLQPARPISKKDVQLLMELIGHLQEKKEEVEIEIQTLEKEIEYMQAWGDFSYKTIMKLKQAGYVVSFFSCPEARFDPQWEEKYNAFIINKIKTVCYFITITKIGTHISIEADHPKMPDTGLDLLRAEHEQNKEVLQHTEDQLKKIAVKDYNTLAEFERSLQNEFNYSQVVAQGERHAGDKLIFLEGWTTVEKAKMVEAELDSHGYFYQQLEISQEDKMPILLKNNRYARLFEPLTRMFALPNHTEIDPTPLLAPFFMLFFGLCFGDAGYGLVLLILGFVLNRRLSRDMWPILSLVQWLGGATLVLGAVVGGVFFGFPIATWPALEPVRNYMFTQDAQMKLSLAMGLLHIVFSKSVAAYKTQRQKGVKHSIAHWAWVMVITSLIIVFGPFVLSLFGEPLNWPPLPPAVVYVCYAIAGASVLIILLFTVPGKMFPSMGMALWNTYNVAAGMLGDTLSYIRLFAIGLTGCILGGVFNMLGIEMTADLPIGLRIPLMLIILLVGHGLNIILGLISSSVHSLRLIFVEYFKNAEYEGGGIAYAPFKKI
ncbi:MAG: ATPase [Tannerella sp.]|jgi:V/A-type H+-transporting ATPase subunit I|nr:ATPase [Tannerella sp.]